MTNACGSHMIDDLDVTSSPVSRRAARNRYAPPCDVRLGIYAGI
jgi:hypothetical protein